MRRLKNVEFFQKCRIFEFYESSNFYEFEKDENVNQAESKAPDSLRNVRRVRFGPNAKLEDGGYATISERFIKKQFLEWIS